MTENRDKKPNDYALTTAESKPRPTLTLAAAAQRQAAQEQFDLAQLVRGKSGDQRTHPRSAPKMIADKPSFDLSTSSKIISEFLEEFSENEEARVEDSKLIEEFNKNGGFTQIGPVPEVPEYKSVEKSQ